MRHKKSAVFSAGNSIKEHQALSSPKKRAIKYEVRSFVMPIFSLGNVVDAEGILAATKVDLVAIICFFD